MSKPKLTKKEINYETEIIKVIEKRGEYIMEQCETKTLHDIYKRKTKKDVFKFEETRYIGSNTVYTIRKIKRGLTFVVSCQLDYVKKQFDKIFSK